jgi:hypothetical protein
MKRIAIFPAFSSACGPDSAFLKKGLPGWRIMTPQNVFSLLNRSDDREHGQTDGMKLNRFLRGKWPTLALAWVCFAGGASWPEPELDLWKQRLYDSWERGHRYGGT